MTSPVGVSFFSAPAPSQDYTWSYVEITKPQKISIPVAQAVGTAIIEELTAIIENTATPSPVDTTITPMPTAPEIPGEMMMEIIENTPASVYVAPTQVPYVAGAPAYSYSSSKYILVDISEQHMYVYDGDSLAYSFVASTGINNATAVGNFAVQSKIPNAYGATWNIWMPNWLGIYWAGGLENGIHALPILPNGATLWEGYLGRPVSYGCVVLGSYESSLLYDWAEIGTTVEIQW
jgi:lipoprotein-anchoring transpeptidase ErfK/SrfK